MTRYRIRRPDYAILDNLPADPAAIVMTREEWLKIDVAALPRPLSVEVDGTPVLVNGRLVTEARSSVKVGRPKGSLELAKPIRRDEISAWWHKTPPEVRTQDALADALKVEKRAVAAYFSGGRWRTFRRTGEQPPQ